MPDRSPLKILVADPHYNQYLLLKHILQNRCNHYCNLFWYGEYAQYHYAIRSGIYDLAIIDADLDRLETLKVDKQSAHHTPVVLMVDHVTRDDAMAASECGVLGLLDKHHLDDPSLACYLTCAELFHNGELEDGFVADVVMLGHHKHSQHPYTYIH